MANQSKVIKLGLEATVLRSRDRGRSLLQMVADCNEALDARREDEEGHGQSVSKAAIERYLSSLDAAAVAPAHQPQLAEKSAVLAIDFAGSITGLHARLERWVNEAEDATKTQVVGSGESAYTVESVDWDARTKTARELRQLLDSYADVMDRVHNAQNVRDFQHAVVEAIREVDPLVGRKIVERLQQMKGAREAALFGMS